MSAFQDATMSGAAFAKRHGRKGNGAASAAEPELPVMAPDAYHGPLGEAVVLIEPQTEACPAGVLIQLLAMYGSAMGRTAYYQVEADRHYANVFAAIVGVMCP